jgi:hypothetical protein
MLCPTWALFWVLENDFVSFRCGYLIDFKFNWIKVWDVERARKEANPVLQLLHRTSRGRKSLRRNQIDQSWPMCTSGEEESMIHWF